MDRRAFFTKLARTGLIAGITGASALALNNRGDGSQSGLPDSICRGCGKVANCNIPEDQVARNQQNRVCYSSVKTK